MDNRYLDFGGPVGTDANGSTTALPDGTTFAYDGLGQIRAVTLPDGEQWTFAYDPFGSLVRWESDASSAAIQYADGRILWTEGDGGERFYLPSDRLGPVAAVHRDPDTSDTQVYYYHYTFGERLAYLSGETGELLEQIEYDAYGSPTFRSGQGDLLSQSSIGSRLLLTGQPYVPELGLHRQGVRWYRPEWGRFLTQDPLGFVDGPNAFSYAHANPLIFIDPTGYARGAPELWHLGGNLVGGAVEGFLGIPGHREPGYELYYSLGEAAGAAGGLLLDVAGLIEGATIAGGGAVACGTGLGCVVGAPAAAGGAALATASIGAASLLHGPKLVDTFGELGDALGKTVFSESINKPPASPPAAAGAGRAGSAPLKQFDELAKLREELGLPAAEAESSKALAKLEIGGAELFGMPGGGVFGGGVRQEIEFMVELAQSTGQKQPLWQFLRHAEGDVFIQAFNRGLKGPAKLFVDKELCGFCRNSIQNMMRLIGIDEVLIITPQNPMGVPFKAVD
jgi:RHS repeat-associated protein